MTKLCLKGVRAVDARRPLDAVQVRDEADPGVRRPVVARAEVEGRIPVPVPGADHRLRGPELERALHGPAIADGPAEREDDGHADTVGLAVTLEDLCGERLMRGEGAEGARFRDRPARRSSGRRADGVARGSVECPPAVPGGGVGVERAGDGVAAGPCADAHDRPAGHPDRDAALRLDVPGARTAGVIDRRAVDVIGDGVGVEEAPSRAPLLHALPMRPRHSVAAAVASARRPSRPRAETATRSSGGIGDPATATYPRPVI